jgi:XTP/dITP diphosphohydrolase
VKLVLATRNLHKVEEIRAILGRPGLAILSLDELVRDPARSAPGGPPSVVEDGATFIDNARKKAFAIARWSGLPALADDSGLAVDALGGRPGVLSSRFAGREGDDQANNLLLLRLLEGVPDPLRTARFLCALCLAEPGGRSWEAEGSVEGVILRERRGEGGFGYDPLFFHPPFGLTFGEAPAERKNAVSHRARALAALALLLPTITETLDPAGAPFSA